MRIRVVILFTVASLLAGRAFAESPIFRGGYENATFYWSTPDNMVVLNVSLFEGSLFFGSDPSYYATLTYSNSHTGQSTYCQQLVAPSEGDYLVMDRSATRASAELDLAASQCYGTPPAYMRATFECQNTADSHQFSYTARSTVRMDGDEVAPGDGHSVLFFTQRASGDSSCRLSFDGGPTLEGPGFIGNATEMRNER